MTVLLELAPEMEQFTKAEARGISLEEYLPDVLAHASQQQEWDEAIPEESRWAD